MLFIWDNYFGIWGPFKLRAKCHYITASFIARLLLYYVQIRLYALND